MNCERTIVQKPYHTIRGFIFSNSKSQKNDPSPIQTHDNPIVTYCNPITIPSIAPFRRWNLPLLTHPPGGHLKAFSHGLCCVCHAGLSENLWGKPPKIDVKYWLIYHRDFWLRLCQDIGTSPKATGVEHFFNGWVKDGLGRTRFQTRPHLETPLDITSCDAFGQLRLGFFAGICGATGAL